MTPTYTVALRRLQPLRVWSLRSSGPLVRGRMCGPLVGGSISLVHGAHDVWKKPTNKRETKTDMKNNIDINKLQTERRRIDALIRGRKSDLRTRWTRPMVAEQRELLTLEREATQLCMLRAWMRGRQHLADADLCRETAERRAAEFQLDVAPLLARGA